MAQEAPQSRCEHNELEAEKEARRRMQTLSREDRVLQELDKIAFGVGSASGRLKAL